MVLRQYLDSVDLPYVSRREWNRAGKGPHSSVYAEYFDGWRKAIDAAGGVTRRKLTSVEMDLVLKAIYDEHDYVSPDLLNELSKSKSTVRIKIGGISRSEVVPSMGRFKKSGDLPKRCKRLGITYKKAGFGTFWGRWQSLCEKLAENIYGRNCIARNYRLETNEGICRADIYVSSKNLVIESMTSSYWTPQKERQKRRYLSSSSAAKVHYWFCWRSPSSLPKEPRIKYFFPEDLIRAYRYRLNSLQCRELRQSSVRTLNQIPADVKALARYRLDVLEQVRAFYEAKRLPLNRPMLKIDFCSKNGLPDAGTIRRAFDGQPLWRIFESIGVPFYRKVDMSEDELIESYRKANAEYQKNSISLSPLPMMKWRNYGRAKKTIKPCAGLTLSQEIRKRAGVT